MTTIVREFYNPDKTLKSVIAVWTRGGYIVSFHEVEAEQALETSYGYPEDRLEDAITKALEFVKY
jgi:hypothetical protein